MAKASIDPGKDWFVVRTNVKCEDKAANNLRIAGFDVYYPRQRYERKHKRTNCITVHERPLMLRYLFVGLRTIDPPFGFVRNCEGVESILGVNGRPMRIPYAIIERIFDEEVNLKFDDTREARIARKEEARTRKETVAMKFRKGLRVTITDGPFASSLGEVSSVTSRGELEILIEIFGREVSAQLQAGQVELVGRTAA